MISYLVERLKSITFFDEVIIATTNNSIDDKFVKFKSNQFLNFKQN